MHHSYGRSGRALSTTSALKFQNYTCRNKLFALVVVLNLCACVYVCVAIVSNCSFVVSFRTTRQLNNRSTKSNSLKCRSDTDPALVLAEIKPQKGKQVCEWPLLPMNSRQSSRHTHTHTQLQPHAHRRESCLGCR